MNKKRLILELLILLLLIAAAVYGIYILFRNKMTPMAYRATETPTSLPAIIPDQLPEMTPWFEHAEGKTALAFFYKPPYNSDDLMVVADHYDAVVLTANDEAERDSLLAAGLKTPVLRYVIFNEIYDQGACVGKPYQNQAAYQAGDLCSLEKDHPDWFLKNERGKAIQIGDNGRMMDPGSEGWRQFFIERVSGYSQEYGWDGFFFDNIEVSTQVFARLTNVSSLYDYEPMHGFMEQEIAYLAEVSGALREEFPDAPIVGNMVDINFSDNQSITDYYRLLRYLNGVMIEDFAADWRTRYKSAEEWEAQMDLVEQTQRLGRNLILVVQNTSSDLDTERLTFGLASYYLVDHGLSAFRYILAGSYRDTGYLSFYSMDLGAPQGERYKDGGIWRRNYEKGSVWVNPTSHEAGILTLKSRP